MIKDWKKIGKPWKNIKKVWKERLMKSLEGCKEKMSSFLMKWNYVSEAFPM